MISERPAEAEDRAVPGHWEGDLILGLGQLGDRHAGRAHAAGSRCCCTCRRPGRTPAQGQERPGARRRTAPRRSATRSPPQISDAARAAAPLADLGPGRGDGPTRQLRIETGLQVYFCDPHSPWQRGTNENTNGLLRQYFPKGTDLARHTAEDLAAVAPPSTADPARHSAGAHPPKYSTSTSRPPNSPHPGHDHPGASRLGRARGDRRYGPPYGRASATTATHLSPELPTPLRCPSNNPVLQRPLEFGLHEPSLFGGAPCPDHRRGRCQR